MFLFMNELLSKSTLFELKETNYIQIGITIGLIILFFVIRKISFRFIRNHAHKYSLDATRIVYMKKLISFLLIVIFATVASIVWEVSFKGLSVFFSAFFTLVGIAFFASWSILSNITASVILFLFFPMKFGAKVKIVDGDNSVIGRVNDVSIFSIKLLQDNGEIVSYPNNLAIQKPIIHLKG